MQVCLHTFVYQSPQCKVDVLVPDESELRQAWVVSKDSGQHIPFPYWGKIWPSALALAKFIENDSSFFQNKKVLELAGGLGLPAMIAAQFASYVTGSDYQQYAVDIMRQSIALNGIGNMDVQLIDWQMLELPLPYDVVLLSDINYEPTLFEALLQLLLRLYQANITVILATPPRLFAKTFMEQLLPLSTRHEVFRVEQEGISIVQL